MATGVEVPRSPSGQGNKPPSLPEKVAQFYYSHGLFCTSYPTTIITLAVAVVLICCYPLVNLPLPGNLPTQVASPNASSAQGSGERPWCYIQQVVVRTAVVPWDPSLSLGDAFRAPLYEVFKLLEVVRNYQHETSAKTLAHLCLHVEAVKRPDNSKHEAILPEYGCLILSPANFWQQDVQKFNEDSHLLTTVFNHQNLQKGKISLAEILFGMNLKDTGIKRYPLRSRQRILQYAITLALKEYDAQFVAGLRAKLGALYPLHQSNASNHSDGGVVYIHYPGVFNYLEVVPLLLTFLLLFCYMYFSVRKIELIKSKLGMAVAAIATVLGSLFMSVGLCFFFGLTLSMQGKEIFPYLVILVGLENILVLTKSVVSTPPHLDVKIRLAQGLSREGWSITKNLLVEITILTIGLATFVPVIQEFCIFAITGLISDFFLQMLFFCTVLGIDVHRMEICAEKGQPSFRNSLYQAPHGLHDAADPYDRAVGCARAGLNRSKSHPRLSSAHTNVLAAPQPPAVPDRRIPKRLRLVNMWARTRFFQRAFMAWMIVWISIIVYNSGVIEHALEVGGHGAPRPPRRSVPGPAEPRNTSSRAAAAHNISFLETGLGSQLLRTRPPGPCHNGTGDLARLRHGEFAPWQRLSTRHWPTIFDKYNLSLSGSYIAVLPGIRISHAVTPEQAVLLRNADERYLPASQWQALAAALDPIDFNEDGGKAPPGGYRSQLDQPYYPNSPMEIFLATILCVISVAVLAYMMVVLYRCVCSRNYAEWRASWSSERADEPVPQLVLEAVPLVLDGHCQEVECLATDGGTVVSSCLGGQLKVWDASTGEQLSSIDRRLYFGGGPGPGRSPEPSPDHDDSLLSDYESGSPPSRDEGSTCFPSLQQRINTDFSRLRLEPTLSAPARRTFDFGAHYRQLYLSHRERPRTADTSRWVADKLAEPEPRVPPIWCVDYMDNLIVLGCANGRLEFWEGVTGRFKCIFEDGAGMGVTSVKLVGSRVIAAKLNGSLDFLQLQSYNQGRQIDWGFTLAYRRTHVRTGSTGSIADCRDYSTQERSVEELRCIRLHTTKAHQQPVTALDSEGGRVLSGSQDHTLRVHRLEDGSPLYTLHGHCGPITCLFIDRVSPMMSGSGSQDGLLCVWDLLTGACVYSIQAHDGSVTCLTYSASYVISMGTDERLCVWERFQGHLLNTIHISNAYVSSVLMLTHNLLVTARQGSLVVLDVRTGETVRVVTLGHQDNCIFVKQMLLLRDAVVCDYSNQLRIVRFPLVSHKME